MPWLTVSASQVEATGFGSLLTLPVGCAAETRNLIACSNDCETEGNVLGSPLLLAPKYKLFSQKKWGSSVLPGEKELEKWRVQLNLFSVQGSGSSWREVVKEVDLSWSRREEEDFSRKS